MCKKIFIFLIIGFISSCSTMGMVAKGAFISAKEIYGVQPKVIQDNQPLFVKKVFYTAELLTTDYEEWKLRLVSESNLGEYFSYNPVIVELEYEVNFQKYNKKVELLYAQNVEIKIKEKYYFAHEFSFSMDGKEFWLKYHESLFDMDKPWFTYQISPSLPLMIKSKIDHVQYNYAPNWGFLSLREFMDLFDLNTDKRWDDFCFWNNYDYDDSSVCGDIRIEDDLELTPKTDS